MAAFTGSRTTAVVILCLLPLPPLLASARLLPYSWSRILSTETVFALWVVLISLTIGYVVNRMEHIVDSLVEWSYRPAQGVEVFHHADTLLARIAELSVNAEEIATLNLSTSPARSPALTNYFAVVDAFLARANGRMRTFRSIATADNATKMHFIIERARRLEGRPHVSLAVFTDTLPDHGLPLLGIHIVKRPEGYCSFIFPRVQASSEVHGILILGREVYDILMGHFNGLWSNERLTFRLLDGGYLDDSAVKRLHSLSLSDP